MSKAMVDTITAALRQAGLTHDVRYVAPSDSSVDGEIELYLGAVKSPIVVQLGADMIAINRFEYDSDGVTPLDIELLHFFGPSMTDGIPAAIIKELQS